MGLRVGGVGAAPEEEDYEIRNAPGPHPLQPGFAGSNPPQSAQSAQPAQPRDFGPLPQPERGGFNVGDFARSLSARRRGDSRSLAIMAQERAARAQGNRTAQYIAQQAQATGNAQLRRIAEGVATGAVPAAAGLQMAQEILRGRDPTADRKVINGQLVNVRTGDVVGDYRTPEGDDVPASFRALAMRAEAAGLKPGTPEYQEFMRKGAGGISIENNMPSLSEAQGKSAQFFYRGDAANKILEPIEAELTSLIGSATEVLPEQLESFFQSDDYQRARQAGREFIASILRKDTGAAVTDQEFALYGPMFLPQPGDGAPVLAQKREARRRALDAIRLGMGDAAVVLDQPPPSSGGSESSGGVTRTLDGVTYRGDGKGNWWVED